MRPTFSQGRGSPRPVRRSPPRALPYNRPLARGKGVLASGADAAMDPLLTARLRLLAAALLFSTGPAAIKACELTQWQVAGFRSGTAALTLFLFVPASRRLAPARLWLV